MATVGSGLQINSHKNSSRSRNWLTSTQYFGRNTAIWGKLALVEPGGVRWGCISPMHKSDASDLCIALVHWTYASDLCIGLMHEVSEGSYARHLSNSSISSGIPLFER